MGGTIGYSLLLGATNLRSAPELKSSSRGDIGSGWRGDNGSGCLGDNGSCCWGETSGCRAGNPDPNPEPNVPVNPRIDLADPAGNGDMSTADWLLLGYISGFISEFSDVIVGSSRDLLCICKEKI